MTVIDDINRPFSKELLLLSLKDYNFANRLLSRELLQLPLQHRNAIEEEIHGVSTLAMKESPKILAAALQELSKELTNIPDTDPIKAAYNESQILPKTYINTPDFRLRFLRCELFDAKKAAIRMVKFLDFAFDLFGPGILSRPMAITDITKEANEYMQRGHVQILPYRDRCGRPIWAFHGDIFSLAETYHKIHLYQHYIMSSDVETQQKGIVVLMWPRSQEYGEPIPPWEKNVNEKLLEIENSTTRLLGAVPTRWSAIHWCLPNGPHYHMLQPAFAILSGNPSQSKTRFHFGAPGELCEKLKTFSIPTDYIPVTGSGAINTAYHKQWIKARDRIEGSENESIAVVMCPGSTDVLFRMGVSMSFHRGNVTFQNVIEEKIKEHSFATQTQKKVIAKGIINFITEKKGRFLQWDSKFEWWIELQEMPKIHTKVSSAIRHSREKIVASESKKKHTIDYLGGNRKRRKLSGNRFLISAV